ncbi:hypothetical protein [Actinokineospora sp.]|uniref:hypothetical protein n=1 Tax=Actinokineospora sp. TaxID=1872133 RepID=UPI0040377C11
MVESVGDQRGTVGKLLPAVLCVAAVGVAVFLFTLSDGDPVVLLPGVVYLVATAAMAWSPAGAAFAPRLGLGLVLAGASVAMAGVAFVLAGRNPNSMVFGLFLLVGALGLTFGGRVGADSGRDLVRWVPLAAVVGGLGVLAVTFVAARGEPSSLVFGCLFLLAAVVMLVGASATGPARFAVGAAVVAASVALTYFLAVSGRTPVSLVFAALFLVSVLGMLVGDRHARSA